MVKGKKIFRSHSKDEPLSSKARFTSKGHFGDYFKYFNFYRTFEQQGNNQNTIQ